MSFFFRFDLQKVPLRIFASHTVLTVVALVISVEYLFRIMLLKSSDLDPERKPFLFSIIYFTKKKKFLSSDNKISFSD